MDLCVGYDHEQNAVAAQPGTAVVGVAAEGGTEGVYSWPAAATCIGSSSGCASCVRNPGMEPAIDALLRCVSEFDMTRLRTLLQPLIEGAA